MWCDLWLTSANPLQILLAFLLHSNEPALYPQPHASLKAKYHSIKPADGSCETFTDATVYVWTAELHTQKSSAFCRSLFMNASVFVCFCACVNLQTRTWQCVYFYILIDFHLIAVISINLHVFLHWSLTEFTITHSGLRTNNLKLMFIKSWEWKLVVANISHTSLALFLHCFITATPTQSHPPWIKRTYFCFHVTIRFLTFALSKNFQVIFQHLPMCILLFQLLFDFSPYALIEMEITSGYLWRKPHMKYTKQIRQ